MTQEELTKACWDIYDKACADMSKLISAAGYKVFADEYDFHEYVRRGKSEFAITDGSELMNEIITERFRRDKHLVFANEENEKTEREHEIAEEIKYAEQRIKQGKALILDAEEKLEMLRKGELPT